MRRRRVDIERDPGASNAQGKSLRRGTGNRPPNDADVVAREERRKRRQEVFLLKMNGASTQAIAEQLQIGVRQVQKDFARACRERAAEANEKDRAIANAQYDQEILRLNLAIQGIEPEANKGNVRAIHALADLSRTKAKIIEMRAKLNGAIAPAKQIHEHTHEVGGAIGVVVAGMTDERLLGMVERARERRRLAELAQGGGKVHLLPRAR